MKMPDDYDGSPEKAKDFLQRCELYFVSKDLRNHLHRIAFVLSYCTKGTAKVWASRKMEEGRYQTWREFSEEFTRTFYSSDTMSRAQHKLNALRQTSTADAYIQEFRLLAHEAQLREENSLIWMFKRGLNPMLLEKVMATLATNPVPVTLQDWYETTQKLDQAYNERLEFSGRQAPRYGVSSYSGYRRKSKSKYREKDHQSRRHKHRRVRQLAVPHDNAYSYEDMQSDAVAILKLSVEERRRCFEQNLCFNCKQAGHRSSNCPTKQSKPRFKSQKGTRRIKQLTFKDKKDEESSADASSESESSSSDSDSSTSTDTDAEEDKEISMRQILATMDDSQLSALVDKASEQNF